MSINYLPFESKSGFKSPNFTVDHLGNVVIDGSLTVTNLALNPETPGSIDNVAIGQTVAAAGTFTDLTVLESIIANPTNGGNIDNVIIGDTVPAAGNFTDLSATLSLILSPSTLGAINNTTVGLTTPAAAKFTNVTLTESATQPNQVITKGYVDSRIPAIAIALGA